jgi:hypothetical protein
MPGAGAAASLLTEDAAAGTNAIHRDLLVIRGFPNSYSIESHQEPYFLTIVTASRIPPSLPSGWDSKGDVVPDSERTSRANLKTWVCVTLNSGGQSGQTYSKRHSGGKIFHRTGTAPAGRRVVNGQPSEVLAGGGCRSYKKRG